MGLELTFVVADEFLEDLFPHVFRNSLPLVPHFQAHAITCSVGLDPGVTAGGRVLHGVFHEVHQKPAQKILVSLDLQPGRASPGQLVLSGMGLGFHLLQQPGKPGAQRDSSLMEFQPQFLGLTNVEDVLDHPSHLTARVPEPANLHLVCRGVVIPLAEEFQPHLDRRKRILQVMDDELEQLFPLFLQLKQVVPFPLNLRLQPLEPHETSDSDNQLPGKDRFPQEIITPGPKGQGMDIRPLISRKENNGQQIAVRYLTDPLADFQPIHPGHLDVQEDQVRGIGGKLGQRLGTILCCFDLIVPPFQHGPEAPARQSVVIHHENLGPVVCPAIRSGLVVHA